MNNKISDERLGEITYKFGKTVADIIKGFDETRSWTAFKRAIELLGGYRRRNISNIKKHNTSNKDKKVIKNNQKKLDWPKTWQRDDGID